MSGAEVARAFKRQLAAGPEPVMPPAMSRPEPAPMRPEPDPCANCGAKLAPFLLADEPGFRPTHRTAFCWKCWQEIATP
jgi:hypothetical protein